MSMPAMPGWQPIPPQSPAYNAVPARTTLARPPPPPPPVRAGRRRTVRISRFDIPPQDQTPEKKPMVWPTPVREYVGRAFEPRNAMPGISTEAVQVKLKEIINHFAEHKMLTELNWAQHPLPQQIIAEERKFAVALPSPHVSAPPSFASHMHAAPFSFAHSSPPASPQPTRKRKSGEVLNPMLDEENLPPWRKTNNVSLKDRMTFGHQDKKQKNSALNSKSNAADLEKRKQRFQSNNVDARNDSESDLMPAGPVVGTNMCLEKPYFRLTAPPKPDTVRPQHVLEKTLEMLGQKWKTEKKYTYMCNQFKSLRQDLTVQHIKNSFTVKVYEYHARIALEKGDLGEYNQCQTQLRALYKSNLGGNPGEFVGYRILYFVYTCNKVDMNDLLAELTPADKKEPAVKHALAVRAALALGNYHKFFRLYLEAPNMGAYLMDMFIERERLNALANISRAYNTVALQFLSNELGFDSNEHCVDFFAAHNAQTLLEPTMTGSNEVTYRVKVKEGAGLFDSLRAAAFGKIDIKGQI
ncbi:hypothetical protein EJ04DRAFT_471557 [Polyplosphaeria fusca]|uniref:PCI domain-containing protein n=1 Tax=Polyplosphaeria fusca TaxID=682080 RepID=A0A9P4V0W6_9PLEO|nr:hypothetical protein EJ04DRAFT_471557 [Polyplosphaeria fusca]